MSAIVVTVGYEPAALVAEDRVVTWFGDSLRREGLEDLADATAEAIAKDRHVVVIYPGWSAEPTLSRIQTVRASLDTTRLVGYPSAVPPLAGAVLAALADALEQYLGCAGLLLAALPVLERQLVTVTWLAKVSGLEEPPPTIWQHVASWWPASAFAATSWPEPAVTQLRNPNELLDLPRPRTAVGLAVASRNGDEGWVQRCVVPALRSPRVREVKPTPLGPARWGSKRLVETVVYPLDVRSTAVSVTRTLDLRRCAWCGEKIASNPCPFCGVSAAERAPLSTGGRV